MSLRASGLIERMLPAVKRVLGSQWNKVEDYAETEISKIAELVLMIEKLRVSGEITVEEACIHFEMQINAIKNVLRFHLLRVGELEVEEIHRAVEAAARAIEHEIQLYDVSFQMIEAESETKEIEKEKKRTKTKAKQKKLRKSKTKGKRKQKKEASKP